MERVYGLVGQVEDDLVDAAAALNLGDGGLRFHWEQSSELMVGFPVDTAAVYFKLAYSGQGRWVEDSLLVPESERQMIGEILAELPFHAHLIELFRVALLTDNEHDQLLDALNPPSNASTRGAFSLPYAR